MKRIEVVLKPEQSELHDTINERIRDVQHLPDRSGGTDIVLSVPAKAAAVLDELGIGYRVPERKKPGPKTQSISRMELHLKFSSEREAFIKRNAPYGYQAFFDEVVDRLMEQQDISEDHKIGL